MNYLKVQQLIMKCPEVFSVDEDYNNFFFSDGVEIVKVPKMECWLNAEKFKRIEGISHHFTEMGAIFIKPTGKLQRAESYVASELAGENVRCWINDRYLTKYRRYEFIDDEECVQVFDAETTDIVAIIQKMTISEKN